MEVLELRTLLTAPTITSIQLVPDGISVVTDLAPPSRELGVQIDYSEPMDITASVTPSVTLADTANQTAVDNSFSYKRAEWSGTQRLTVWFDVIDQNVEVPDIDIQVSGGRDAQLEPFQGVFTAFDIVLLDTRGPVATIDRFTSSPTSLHPVVFRLQFSESAFGFGTSDLMVAGTAFTGGAGPSLNLNGPFGGTYEIEVTGMSQSGTVVLSYTGQVTDQYGNVGTDSVIINDTITVDYDRPTSSVTFPLKPFDPLNHYNSATWATNGNAISGTYVDPGNPSGGHIEVSISRGVAPSSEYWNGTQFVSGPPLFHNVSVVNGQWSYPFTPPAEGDYTLGFEAVDAAAQHESPGHLVMFSIDNTTPTSSIVSTAVNASTRKLDLELSYLDNRLPYPPAMFELQIWKVPSGSSAWQQLPNQTVPLAPAPLNTIFSFDVDSNAYYDIRVIAIDAAGNREVKAAQNGDVSVYVPDIHAPETSVTAAAQSLTDPWLIELSMSGSDVGSGLKTFEVWMSTDGGASYNKVAEVPAGNPVAGAYTAQATISVIPGVTNYKFYSIGVDGDGNRESAPGSSPGFDAEVNIPLPTVTPAPEVTAFSVQNGQQQRSHVQYLKVDFNDTSVIDAIFADLGSRARLAKSDFTNDALLGTVALSAGNVSRSGGSLLFDFGSRLDDAYYRLQFDLDGDGSFDDLGGTFGTSLNFHCMLGDGNNDGQVTRADVGLDLSGDGKVNTTDVLFFRSGWLKYGRMGTAVAADLFDEEDDKTP
ncbi:MAG: hypothetical protein KDA89_11790 [Planctomycetaceae bacterium]|nr:hypothetical protein [Planctomycetaceae bacterium]